jgi:hypothetical protein
LVIEATPSVQNPVNKIDVTNCKKRPRRRKDNYTKQYLWLVIMKRLLIFSALISIFHLRANANFDYNDNCTAAYKAILSLRMNEAKQLLQKERQRNAQNGVIILLDNYLDYFSLLSSENKAEYEKLKGAGGTRISLLEKNDNKSPYYLYSQAEIYLQWSLLKARFGDYVSSAYDAKKAEGLLKENSKKFPGFLPDQINSALVNIIFGSVPANLKGITRFLGMHGEVQAGIKQLEDLQAKLPKTKFDFLNDEVVFLICTVDVNILHDVNSYDKLTGYLASMESASLLKVYLQGYVAVKTAHNDEAIVFLENAPKSNQYIDVPAISYLLGNAKLNRMDTDAPVFLTRFIEGNRGINLVKDAYLKLGYFYLVTGDNKKYEYYVKLVKTRGSAIDEKDKQALREANDVKPDADLLKARFYFDGGYYSKALSQISNRNINSFKVLRDRIEFYYRTGRIYDKTGKAYEAVINYRKAISLGKNTTYYFAANSALRAGNIFEQLKDFDKAANYYNQALEMKGHEYQGSIDNDAKEGLKRIDR